MARLVEKLMPGKKVEAFLTEYHINYRGWDPRDKRLGSCFGGTFAASVLINMAYKDTDSCFIHDVLSAHYGLLGRPGRDRFAEAWGGA